MCSIAKRQTEAIDSALNTIQLRTCIKFIDCDIDDEVLTIYPQYLYFGHRERRSYCEDNNSC